MRTRAIAVTAAVSAALIGMTGPALAGSTGPDPTSTVRLSDGTDDLWVIGPGEDDWDPFGHRRPSVEVVAARARHSATAIAATLYFVDLRAGRTQDFSLRVRSDQPFRRAIVSVDPEHPGGRDRLLDRSEQVLSCPGLRHHVDYDAETVRIVLPRECAGGPAWVRVALATYQFRTWDTISDNPHNDGPEPAFTGRLVAAPGESVGQRGRPSAAAQPGQAP